jgi:hypothetical protein
MHDRHVGILDQGNIGSCTGNAGTAALGTGNLWPAASGLALDEAYAVSLYSAATAVDEFDGTYPPDDTGSSGLAVAKVLRSRGLITSYSHCFTLADALAAACDGPVITGISWMSGFDSPDADGIVRITGDDTVLGGHEVCVVGVDAERRLVRIANSWGDGWGDSGYFWLGWDDWGVLLADQGDVTVLVPASAPPPATADQALAKVLRQRSWIDLNFRSPGQTGTVARAAKAWLKAKGM